MRRIIAAALLMVPGSAIAGGSLTGGSITQPNLTPAAVTQQINTTAVAKAGGIATNTVTTAAAPGGTTPVPAGMRNGARLTVLDYATNGVVGGASSTILLASQAVGDNVAQLISSSAVPIPSGAHVVASGLSASTVVTGIGGSSTVNSAVATSDYTLPDSLQSAITTPHGMSTALVFGNAQVLPVGASVSGTGIPSGTSVVALSSDGKTVYINQAVTAQVATGSQITFSYVSQPVYFSQGWTTAPTAGLPIGFYVQDDYAAFNNAAFFNDPVAASGSGARIYVPSGKYFLSSPVFTRNGTSFEFGPSVSFIPGSALIDAANGSFPSYSQMSLIGSGQGPNPVPTQMNISQVLYQRSVPDTQGQGLLVQQNDNCVNDGGGSWGCGMVAEEVKQNASPRIRGGALWEYHGTDVILPGQRFAWVGGELEVVNGSGFWGAFSGNNLNGNTVGLHIDNKKNDVDPTHVANSYAFDPAGDWHTMSQCDNSILDWCLAHSDGFFSNQQPMPDSGLDSKGRVFGSKLIAMQPAGDTGGSIGVIAATTRTAEMNKDGSIGAATINTPILTNQTAGVASIAIEDGGRFNGPVALAIGAPPAGGTQATAHVSGYTLRAVQGAAAINASYQDGSGSSNAPVGVTAGMVFSLAGGTCTTQPQVTFDGTEFVVSRAGLCSVLPNDGIHTLPVGMIRSQFQLTYVSGGSAAPATLPVIEPLYSIASVAIDNAGSGYNAAVPPDILGETSFTPSVWTGIIYTPIRLASVMGTATTAPVALPSGAVVGGKVALDNDGTMWVQEVSGKVIVGTGTTNLFSIDSSGNVIAKGTVTQSGTP